MTPGHFIFLKFSWPCVHETSQKIDALFFSKFHNPGYTKLHKKSGSIIFSNFHDPWYKKIHKNQMLQFSPIFMTLWAQNFTKNKMLQFYPIFIGYRIEASDFCEILCTRGHENWRKLKHLIFFEVSCFRGHENWRKMKCLIFVKFCLPGVMIIGGKWSIWFLWSFMYPAGVMKIEENWSVWLFWSFMYPGSWKLEKIEAYDFFEVSCTQGHENRWKWRIWFLWCFMYPVMKIAWSRFLIPVISGLQPLGLNIFPTTSATLQR